MTDEDEVRRTAKVFSDKYGADALRQANLRLIDVRRGGDAEIIAYWRDVLSALAALKP